jgi:hypothetical protein
MSDTLTNKYLPDFTKEKVSKEEAAELLYQALCKQARVSATIQLGKFQNNHIKIVNTLKRDHGFI